MASRGPDAFDVVNNVGTNSKNSKASNQQRQLSDYYKAIAKVFGTEFADITSAYAKKQAKEDADAQRKLAKEGLEMQAKYAKTATERFQASLKLVGANFIDNLKKVAASFTKAVDSSVSAYAQIYQKYQASVNARLQGSGLDFQGMSTTVQGNLMLSPYVKQTVVLENLAKLVEAGTAYNVEQRAFLASISDKIATTFSAFDSNLMNIIRIQQADSTVARLGMEAQLTQYLNSRYKDTSYLSNAFDTVAGNLFATSSTMSREQSLEFEYQVQKWLGSLGSVGVGTNTLANLSQMIGALGTGDISALQSNQSLQNLLAIASNGSFGGLLTGGLNSRNTNQLLYNLVSYLGGIQGNNVVKTQLAQIFGISRSDLEAIANLTQSDLNNIFGTNLSYGGAVRETSSQLGQVKNRMHISELISNVFSNLTHSLGGAVANSPAAYVSWMATNLMSGATGGTNIPTIGALGNFVELNATVEQLMKLGIMAGAGIGTGMVGQALSSLSNGGSLSLENWNARDNISRGGGFTGIRQGTSVDVSATQYIGSGSSSEVYQQTVTSAREAAAEEAKSSVTPEDLLAKNVQGIYDLLQSVANGTASLNVKIENYGLTGVSI